MNENSCLICHHQDFEELYHNAKLPILFGAIPSESRGSVKSYPLTISICKNCSLVQQINLLDESILHEIYTAEYFSCPAPISTGMGIGEKEKYFSFFQSCGLEPGKMLEIACYDGYFLIKLEEKGWDVYGIDPSPMVQTAINQFGEERVTKGFFTKEIYSPKSFDVILFRNLLEHLYNIHDFIEGVNASLKLEGRIFIEVPNILELLNTGYVGAFFHQHIAYFSIETITSFLGMHGFQVEEYREGLFLYISAVKVSDSTNSLIPPKTHQLEKAIIAYKNEQQKIEDNSQKIFNNPKNKRIALFGASSQTTTTINSLSSSKVALITHIFDNDVGKHGKYIWGCDVAISSPSAINSSDFDIMIISTFMFEKEIYDQLIDLGVDKTRITTLYG